MGGDLIEDRLEVRVYSQCPRERGPRHRVASQCQVNHSRVEVKPGIGGLKPQRRDYMRQSLGCLAAAVKSPCERVVPVDVLTDREFARGQIDRLLIFEVVVGV